TAPAPTCTRVLMMTVEFDCEAPTATSPPPPLVESAVPNPSASVVSRKSPPLVTLAPEPTATVTEAFTYVVVSARWTLTNPPPDDRTVVDEMRAPLGTVPNCEIGLRSCVPEVAALRSMTILPVPLPVPRSTGPATNEPAASPVARPAIPRLMAAPPTVCASWNEVAVRLMTWYWPPSTSPSSGRAFTAYSLWTVSAPAAELSPVSARCWTRMGTSTYTGTWVMFPAPSSTSS